VRTGVSTAACYAIYGKNWISGSVTDEFGLYSNAPGYAGAITNSYGLFVGDRTRGTSGNWAIKTGLGKVQFGDTVTLDSLSASQVVLTDASNNLVSGGTLGSAAAAIFPICTFICSLFVCSLAALIGSCYQVAIAARSHVFVALHT